MPAKRITGFAPICGRQPRVLILGSMPSEASLQKQQYYGHARNGFWPIMAALFGFDADDSYRERTRALQQNHIALWDVVDSCVRQGSLDSAIEAGTVRVNDFATFFKQHPSVRHVFFNGQRAAQEYRRHVAPTLGQVDGDFSYEVLPSTSPAMASLTRQQKIARWRAVAQALR